MEEDTVMAANVEVRGLEQRLGRGTQVFEGLDLDIGRGVFGLLGPNGAGKTTLLRTLATLIKPTRGSVRLLGLDPADRGQRRALRRRLGYLPQHLGYYPSYTVSEFVEYFALLKEVPNSKIKPAVSEAIERVGLPDQASTRLKTLSGGMLRRVGIAQAIVNEPELLLLDEPTVGLDPEQRVELRALLRELGKKNTVVVSTHLIEDMATACTDVALLDVGVVRFRGTPESLVAIGEDGAGPGDSPLERGYSSVLRASREGATPTAEAAP
jgi:ABC-type multidrug transport system ATPase subunit